MGAGRWIVVVAGLTIGASSAGAQMTNMVITPYGVYGGPFGYDPLWDTGGPIYYDPYVVPYDGVWTLPPVVIPAESMYGPQVMKNFMGLNQPQAPIVNYTVVNTPTTPPPVRTVRSSNARSRALAGEYLRHGDEYFRRQQYNLAYDRYKAAHAAAPDVADTLFRQGLALVALAQRERAGEAIRRGLTLDDDWPRSRFQLSELYADNQAAKVAMLDALAAEAERQPRDDNLLFLLGVELYFDGEQARSRTFFEEAKRLAAGRNEHVEPFLTVLEELARAEGRREL